MSNLPENITPYDFARIQLMGQLSSVADSMRKCADIAEHFSQVVAHLGPNGGLPSVPHFHSGPMAEMGKMGPPPVPATAPTPVNGKRKAQVLASGEAKKKKVKKPRDPEAPKRPPSSYLLFQNEVRQAMKKANPGMANHEILTTISQRWASMTPEEKDTYHKRQEVAKAQYTLEKTAYDQRRVPATEEVVSPPADAATIPSPAMAPAPLSPAAIKISKVPAVAETSTSGDDSSEGGTSESESSDEDDDAESEPVQKKAKKATTSKAQSVPKKVARKKNNS